AAQGKNSNENSRLATWASGRGQLPPIEKLLQHVGGCFSGILHLGRRPGGQLARRELLVGYFAVARQRLGITCLFFFWLVAGSNRLVQAELARLRIDGSAGLVL